MAPAVRFYFGSVELVLNTERDCRGGALMTTNAVAGSPALCESSVHAFALEGVCNVVRWACEILSGRLYDATAPIHTLLVICRFLSIAAVMVAGVCGVQTTIGSSRGP